MKKRIFVVTRMARGDFEFIKAFETEEKAQDFIDEACKDGNYKPVHYDITDLDLV